MWTKYLELLKSGCWSCWTGGRSMQCKYYQSLLGQTCKWSFWRGGHFIEVVFEIGSTVNCN